MNRVPAHLAAHPLASLNRLQDLAGPMLDAEPTRSSLGYRFHYELADFILASRHMKRHQWLWLSGITGVAVAR